MATITRVIVTDDIDGTEGAGNVRFGLDGVELSIDLTPEREKALREYLAPFVQNARRVGGKKVSVRQLASAGVDMMQARAWAKEHGFPVSDRGRLPEDILMTYKNRHTPEGMERAAAQKAFAERGFVQDQAESLESEEGLADDREIIGKMTEDGWYYASFEDAVTVAARQGRHAIRKDDGGLVVLELGVPYRESLEKAAEAEKKVSPAKTNKNATAAVLRKMAADSVSVDTKEGFVQQAKAWLRDKTKLSQKTLDTADWDEIFEHFKYLRSEPKDTTEKRSTRAARRSTTSS